jgi:hypothetical protein
MKESFEDSMGKSMYPTGREKSHTDKVLAKEDVNSIAELISKDWLSAGDLRRLHYLLASIESKLGNYGHKDRYILGVYSTKIRRLISIQLASNKNIEILQGKPETTDNTKLAVKQATQLLDEYIKARCNLYLYVSRSSLSIDGHAFDTLNTDSFEYEYNQHQTSVMGQQKQGFQLPFFGRKDNGGGA